MLWWRHRTVQTVPKIFETVCKITSHKAWASLVMIASLALKLGWPIFSPFVKLNWRPLKAWHFKASNDIITILPHSCHLEHGHFASLSGHQPQTFLARVYYNTKLDFSMNFLTMNLVRTFPLQVSYFSFHSRNRILSTSGWSSIRACCLPW